MNGINKKIIIFLLFVVFVGGLCRTGSAKMVDKIAVVVNDQSITSLEIEQAVISIEENLKKSYSGQELDERLSLVRKKVTEQLIVEKLILQEAKKQAIKVKNEEVERRIEQIKSRFPSERSFQHALRLQGMNMRAFKKKQKEQIMVKKMIRRYLRSRIQITPAQISQYYRQHMDDFKLVPAVVLSQILIRYKSDEDFLRAEKTAVQVMELLSAGVDFADAAKKYSEGPNAEAGGNIGIVERGIMAKEIDDVIFMMKEGEISKPIKTSAGLIILKINSVRNERFCPLEKVKDEIEETLSDINTETLIEDWIAQLKDKAFISVKE